MTHRGPHWSTAEREYFDEAILAIANVPQGGLNAFFRDLAVSMYADLRSRGEERRVYTQGMLYQRWNGQERERLAFHRDNTDAAPLIREASAGRPSAEPAGSSMSGSEESPAASSSPADEMRTEVEVDLGGNRRIMLYFCSFRGCDMPYNNRYDLNYHVRNRHANQCPIEDRRRVEAMPDSSSSSPSFIESTQDSEAEEADNAASRILRTPGADGRHLLPNLSIPGLIGLEAGREPAIMQSQRKRAVSSEADADTDGVSSHQSPSRKKLKCEDDQQAAMSPSKPSRQLPLVVATINEPSGSLPPTARMTVGDDARPLPAAIPLNQEPPVTQATNKDQMHNGLQSNVQHWSSYWERPYSDRRFLARLVVIREQAIPAGTLTEAMAARNCDDPEPPRLPDSEDRAPVQTGLQSGQSARSPILINSDDEDSWPIARSEYTSTNSNSSHHEGSDAALDDESGPDEPQAQPGQEPH